VALGRSSLRNLLLAAICVVLALAVYCGLKRKPVAPRAYDPWVMTTTTPEAGFPTYLGNGFIGARIGPEGWGTVDGKTLGCFMAGLYDGERLVGIPDWTSFKLQPLNGQFLMERRLPYSQSLDMRNGCLRTRYSMRSGGDVIDVDVSQFISRVRPGIALTRLSVRPRQDIWLGVRDGYGGIAGNLVPDRRRGSGVKAQGTLGESVLLYRTTDGSARIAMLGKLTYPGGATLRKFSSAESARNLVYARLKNGKTYTYVRFTSIAHTGRWGYPARPAYAALKSALATGAQRLIAEHQEAWRKLWAADIKIEGDPEAQQIVHSCMFYLLQSARPGRDWSIPPTGLSAGAYNGHVFWDADTWMFPALLPQHPKMAKSIVDYRFKTLSGARANARRRGLAGVEYAWESARSGRETIGYPFSEERHITADVALAQWQYYLATGDSGWLRRYGHTVIRETANYWVSRAVYNKPKDRYEIRRVLPPDEVAEVVDNSVYTNAAARLNLQIAIKARRRLGRMYPYAWRRVADKMYLPFDSKNGRYLEYDGYRGEPTKQADTELLIYPLEVPMPPRVAVKTFDYYKSRVMSRGPAMASSAHAIIAARIGRADEAYGFFRKSYRPYLRGPFNMFNEKPSPRIANTCFLTGAAGTLQSVIYGFGGLRMGAEKLEASPVLPKQWKRLTITEIKWRGKTYDLIVEPKSYRLRRVSPAVASMKAPNKS